MTETPIAREVWSTRLGYFNGFRKYFVYFADDVCMYGYGFLAFLQGRENSLKSLDKP